MMALTDKLTAGPRIAATQAESGAGLLPDLLKNAPGSGDFSRIADVAPGARRLIDPAPSADAGLGGMPGGLASTFTADKLGTLAGLAGGFGTLDMDAGMISRFAPIRLSSLKDPGVNDLRALAGPVTGDH